MLPRHRAVRYQTAGGVRRGLPAGGGIQPAISRLPGTTWGTRSAVFIVTRKPIAAYDTALRQNSNYVNAFMNRATALLWDGQLQAGLESVQRALALAPGGSGSQESARHGQALARPTRRGGAASILELIKLKPDDAELHKNLSMILLLPRRVQARLAGIFLAAERGVNSASPACRARSGTEHPSTAARSCCWPNKGWGTPSSSSATRRF